MYASSFLSSAFSRNNWDHGYPWANDVQGIVSPQEGTRGVNEVKAYATKVYADLLAIENEQLGTASSLFLFCRLDVSFMETEKHTFSLFVAGVERGWGTNLFSHFHLSFTKALLFRMAQSISRYRTLVQSHDARQ